MKKIITFLCAVLLGITAYAADPTVGNGIVVGDTVVPGSPTYPASSEVFHHGGWHAVANTAARTNLASYLRRAGMAVLQTDNNQIYILDNDLTNWIEYVAAAAEGLTTNNSPTMADGTLWLFAQAGVTNDATAETDIVNLRTMEEAINSIPTASIGNIRTLTNHVDFVTDWYDGESFYDPVGLNWVASDGLRTNGVITTNFYLGSINQSRWGMLTSYGGNTYTNMYCDTPFTDTPEIFFPHGIRVSNILDLEGAALIGTPETGFTNLFLAGTTVVSNMISMTPTSGPPTAVRGTVWYDEDDDALTIQTQFGDVRINAGKETVADVHNETGATITNGTPVFVTGAQGDRITVSPAYIDGGYSSHAIGVATMDIEDGSNGVVTVRGIVRDVNTSAWPVDTRLYLSETPGVYSTNAVYGPWGASCVAVVLRQQVNTGRLFVSPTRIYSDDCVSNYMASVGMTTNSSPTMAAGTSWSFAFAGVTNDATSDTDVVNLRTMENAGYLTAEGDPFYMEDAAYIGEYLGYGYEAYGWGNHGTNEYAQFKSALPTPNIYTNDWLWRFADPAYPDRYVEMGYEGEEYGLTIQSYGPINAFKVIGYGNFTGLNITSNCAADTFSGRGIGLTDIPWAAITNPPVETDPELAIQNGATLDPSGFESPELVDVAYDPTNRTMTVTQSGGVIMWWRGEKITLSSPWTSTAHGAGVGNYWLAMRDSTNIVWTTNVAWTIPMAQIGVARITSSLTNGFREAHGLMPWEAHLELHQQIGTYVSSGCTADPATYALNMAVPVDASNTVGFLAGVIKDEDCPTTIPAWPQDLYSVLWFTGSGTVNMTVTNTFPYRVGTTYPLVNGVSSGTFSETETVQNRWLNYYHILLPVTSDPLSQQYRMIVLQPQTAHSSLSAALTEDYRSLNLGSFAAFGPEMVAYCKLTYRTSSSYTTTGKVRLENVAYLTGSQATQVSVGSITAPTVASAIATTVTGFDGNLSSADLNVQLALDTLDNKTNWPWASLTNAPAGFYPSNTASVTWTPIATNAEGTVTWQATSTGGAGDNLGNGDGGGTVTISNIVSIADAGGTNSVDPNNRTLYAPDGTTPQINWDDTGVPAAIYLWNGMVIYGNAVGDSVDGSVSADFNNRYLNDDNTFTSVDWGLRVAYDSAEKYSIDWDNRALHTLDGSNVIQTALSWANFDAVDGITPRVTLPFGVADANIYFSVDPNNRLLYDSTGTNVVLDWSTTETFSNSVAAVVTGGAGDNLGNGDGGGTITISNVAAINMGGSTINVNYGGFRGDGGPVISVMQTNRFLVDLGGSDNTIKMDITGTTITGPFAASNATFAGSVTTADTSGKSSFNSENRKLYDSTGTNVVLDWSSNKTARVNGRVVHTPVTLTYSGTNIETDASLANVFRVTLTNDAYLVAPTNLVDGQHIRWWFTQGTGTNILTVDTNFFVFPTGTTNLTFSTAVGSKDELLGTYDGTSTNFHLDGLMLFDR